MMMMAMMMMVMMITIVIDNESFLVMEIYVMSWQRYHHNDDDHEQDGDQDGDQDDDHDADVHEQSGKEGECGAHWKLWPHYCNNGTARYNVTSFN